MSLLITMRLSEPLATILQILANDQFCTYASLGRQGIMALLSRDSTINSLKQGLGKKINKELLVSKKITEGDIFDYLNRYVS